MTDTFEKLVYESVYNILTNLFGDALLFSEKFGLVWFSCIPSFNLLLCLELVGGGGWVGGWTLVFIFSPNLKTKTLLRPRPKVNNNDIYFETWKMKYRVYKVNYFDW